MCAGLDGLKKTTIKVQMKGYTCPLCTIAKASITEKVCLKTPGKGAQVSSESFSTSMNALKDSIINDLKECLPAIIKSEINDSSMTTDNPKPAIVNIPTVEHNLVIKPNDNEEEVYTPSTWKEVVKNKLPKKLTNLPVQRTRLTNKGLGYLAFPDKETRDQAAETLKNDFSVKPEDKNIKTVYPKVKISGLNKEKFTKENIPELRKEILNKNKALKDVVESQQKIFDILFVSGNKEQKYAFAVAKVDPLVRELLQKNGNKLFVDLTACRVSDRVHLLQCYTCQSFGHKMGSDRCSLKDKQTNICLYCSKNHLSKECALKKTKNTDSYKCSNCSKSPIESIKSNAMGHTTTSHNCPIFQKELKNLLSRTMGMSSTSELPKNAIVT